MSWVLGIFTGFFLFGLPGWVLLSALIKRWGDLGWIEKALLATGAGLAFYPILFLFTHQIGLQLGSLYAWLPPIASLILIVWQQRKPLLDLRSWASKKWPQRLSLSDLTADLSFLVIAVLIIAVRYWNARGLVAPMWGDSYQHTMMAQLVLDQKGLFTSWEPYVPYQSLSTHFGFPVCVALFAWVVNIGILPATIIFGQLINCLSVFMLYPLTMRISQNNRWAVCITVLVAGLFTQSPAQYVNWGRYPQLAGQVILPVAAWLLWDLFDAQLTPNPEQKEGKTRVRPFFLTNWRKPLLMGIILTGMTLHYYRMPYYFAALVAAWLVVWVLPVLRLDYRRWIKLIGSLIMSASITALLLLPWVINAFSVKLQLPVQPSPVSGSVVSNVLSDYRTWLELTDYVPGVVVIAGIVAWIISLIRKKWVVASIGFWFLLLSLSVAGRLINLPGANAMQNFAIIIALYIPASLLVGWFIGDIIGSVTKPSNFFGTIIVSVTIIAFAVGGAIKLRNIADPNFYGLVDRTDFQAMKWIRANTPADSRFLVEGFRINAGTSAVGSDAGWWISLLAARQNTMPPQYAILNEIPSPSDYSQKVVELVAYLENHSPGLPDTVQRLCAEHITHAYIGQGQGKVGFTAVQLFSPQDFQNSLYWETIYQQDNVYIFVLNQSYCHSGL
jgi:hypothetical protein